VVDTGRSFDQGLSDGVCFHSAFICFTVNCTLPPDLSSSIPSFCPGERKRAERPQLRRSKGGTKQSRGPTRGRGGAEAEASQGRSCGGSERELEAEQRRSWGGAGWSCGGARVWREWNERGAKAGRGRRQSGVELRGGGGGAERSGGGAEAGRSVAEVGLKQLGQPRGIPVAAENAVDVDLLTVKDCGAAGCCRALQSSRLGRT